MGVNYNTFESSSINAEYPKDMAMPNQYGFGGLEAHAVTYMVRVSLLKKIFLQVLKLVLPMFTIQTLKMITLGHHWVDSSTTVIDLIVK